MSRLSSLWDGFVLGKTLLDPYPWQMCDGTARVFAYDNSGLVQPRGLLLDALYTLLTNSIGALQIETQRLGIMIPSSGGQPL
jgi:hypothetical protein